MWANFLWANFLWASFLWTKFVWANFLWAKFLWANFLWAKFLWANFCELTFCELTFLQMCKQRHPTTHPGSIPKKPTFLSYIHYFYIEIYLCTDRVFFKGNFKYYMYSKFCGPDSANRWKKGARTVHFETAILSPRSQSVETWKFVETCMFGTRIWSEFL